MKRWEAWWNHAALAGVALTGLVYGVVKYFVPNPDPDSRVGHPWQPGLMKAHLLVAPLAVLGVGLILRHHALRKRRQDEESGKRTGALLLWLFLPLIFSGYLIQVFVEPGVVRASGWGHAGLGAVVLLAYAFHPKRRAANGNGDD